MKRGEKKGCRVPSEGLWSGLRSLLGEPRVSGTLQNIPGPKLGPGAGGGAGWGCGLGDVGSQKRWSECQLCPFTAPSSKEEASFTPL